MTSYLYYGSSKAADYERDKRCAACDDNDKNHLSDQPTMRVLVVRVKNDSGRRARDEGL